MGQSRNLPEKWWHNSLSVAGAASRTPSTTSLLAFTVKDFDHLSNVLVKLLVKLTNLVVVQLLVQVLLLVLLVKWTWSCVLLALCTTCWLQDACDGSTPHLYTASHKCETSASTFRLAKDYKTHS